MGLNSDDYRRGLQALLPPGAAWSRDPDRTLTRFLAALADELARVDARAGGLLEEIDPRTTSELLPDWERAFDLPDQCSAPGETLAARRAALLARMTTTGGQSAPYFINLAAALGFTISIIEFLPFKVGTTPNSQVGDALTSGPWAFAWQVNAPGITARFFKVGQARVGEPLRVWGAEAVLECVLRRLKPAHTEVLFQYAI